jgi:hypothetical protein
VEDLNRLVRKREKRKARKRLVVGHIIAYISDAKQDQIIDLENFCIFADGIHHSSGVLDMAAKGFCNCLAKDPRYLHFLSQ